MNVKFTKSHACSIPVADMAGIGIFTSLRFVLPDFLLIYSYPKSNYYAEYRDNVFSFLYLPFC